MTVLQAIADCVRWPPANTRRGHLADGLAEAGHRVRLAPAAATVAGGRQLLADEPRGRGRFELEPAFVEQAGFRCTTLATARELVGIGSDSASG